MNIGCDIESVEVFREKWKKKQLHFFKRIFSADEISYCKKFKDPAIHFAARFCAKEALVKAANKECSFLVTDVHVMKDAKGAPMIKIWKKRKKVSDFFNTHEIMVSISHTSDMAMACVLIRKKSASFIA